MDKPQKPAEPRARAPSLSGYSQLREEDARPHVHVERKSRASDEPMGETDREFILGKLHEQTEYIVGKINDVSNKVASDQKENERRFLELEKARLEDQQGRVAVQEVVGQVRELNANMRQLFDSDRMQNQDIGKLSAEVARVNKPIVKAEAATEGYAAGAASGKLAARFWSLLMAVLVTVATAGLQYCQHQVQSGAFDDPAPKAKP